MMRRRPLSLITLVLIICISVVGGNIIYLQYQERDVTALRSVLGALAVKAITKPQLEARMPLIGELATTTDFQLNKFNESSSQVELGVFRDYDPAEIQIGNYEQTLLFFYAGWSPLSRELEKEITVNADQIPANLQILKVDFDKRLSLKQKYKVEAENTIVRIDSSGQARAKWLATKLFSDLINNITES